jgi:ABC-type transporter Mla subunit MlaD
MRIGSSGVQLHQDASAQIRWRTLLGGLMFIDLHPGSAAAPLSGPIPAGRTSNQVELDQLLETYAGNVATQQRNLFKGLRGTFADPQGIGTTVQTLAPALQTVDRGLRPLLGQQSDDLPGLVAQTARTLKGLNDTTNLQSLVSAADRTLAVTDAQRQDLGQTIDLSPPALQSTATTMTRLRTTLDRLDPLVSSLRPGARALAPAAQAATPALAQTEAVLGELRPLLRAAGPTFDALRRASPAGVSLIDGLRPTVDRTNTNLLPWLHQRDSGTGLAVYQMIGPFWSDLAMAAGEYDAVGYRIRFTVPLGSSSFLGSPVASQMAAACARSSLARHAQACPKAISLLAKSWFGARTGGGR